MCFYCVRKSKKVIIDLEVDPSQILFSSFNVEALKLMQFWLPQVRRGLLFKVIPDNALLLLAQIDAYSLHCNYLFLTGKKAKWVKQHGYQLYCYTADVPEQVYQYWEWGVDMMISNVPQAYRHIDDELKA